MTNEPVPGLSTALAMAQAEGRLTTASIFDLHSADGATIAISSRAVLMVGSAPPPGVMRKVTAFFEGGEHTFLGDQVNLKFEGQAQPTPAASYPILLPNQLSLRYGQIIGLAGDFYGFPDSPISSDPTGQTFKDAFDSLARLPASKAEATQILQTMQTEIDAVNKAIANGVDPSTAYDAMGDQLNKLYNHDTGGGYNYVPRGRYLLLAATNWDHFGASAVAAYTTGHNQAQLAATAAGKLTDPTARRAGLELAYAMNAFADHFLTDLFSSGHLRTPRKEMHETLVGDTGSLCARMMHDEDSCYGLQVTNASGDAWTAYGDKRLRDRVNAGNLQRAEAAVQVSVDEVWLAFQGADPTWGALRLVPDFEALLNNPTNPVNNSPLFRVINGQIAQRSPVGNLKSYQWTTFWTSITTFAFSHWLANMSACGDREKAVTDRAFLAVAPNGVDPCMILYDHNAAGTMGPVGLTSMLAFQTRNLLIGDINSDGTPEVINIPDYDAVQVFGLSGTSAFVLLDTLPSSIPAIGDVGALIVDASGEGDNRIVRTFLNPTNQSLGLLTYRMEDGRIVVTQNTPDLGTGQIYGPQGETGMVAIDMNGDGRQQLALLYGSAVSYSSTDTQTLALFSPDSTGQFSLSKQGVMPITMAPQGFDSSTPNVWWLLPVDANGDGKTELAQVFAYPGNPAKPDLWFFGMHLYGPDGAGGYKEISTNFQMGPTYGASAALWFVADYDGDGCDEIILLTPASYTPNVQLIIFKYQIDPHVPQTNWYYQTFIVNTELCPPWDSLLGATVVNKHKKGSNDHLVLFWNNGGQLTMRVIGGGKALRILDDYPVEPVRNNNATYYSLELPGGDTD